MASPVASDVASGSSLGALSAPPLTNEWEVLSMSMSSSAFGPPSTPSTLSIPPPPVSTPLSEADADLPHLPGAVDSFGCDRVVQKLPLEEERPFVDADKRAEPFAEGWKSELPELMAHGKFKGDRLQEICREEPGNDANAFMGEFKMSDDDQVRATKRGISPTRCLGQSEEPVTMKNRKCQSLTKLLPFGKSEVVWSIATATAILGFAIVLHQLHQERAENHHLRLKISAKDQELERLMSGMSRLQKMLRRSL